MGKRCFMVGFGVLLLWLAYIWGSNLLFNKNYSQRELDIIFSRAGVLAPKMDSITLEGFHVYYLTNESPSIHLSKSSKPYLILLHDSGRNSGYFIDYFLNEEISKKFHIIAIDRIGFGKTHRASDNKNIQEFSPETRILNSKIIKSILNREGRRSEQVRIISTGSSALVAVKAYTYMEDLATKAYLFYPKVDPRFFASRGFSKLVTYEPVSYLFPRNFVNKHKDLLLWDVPRDEKREELFDSLFRTEEKILNNNFIKPSLADYEPVYFFVTHHKFKDKIKDITGKGKFKVVTIKRKSIYHRPRFIVNEILGNESYKLGGPLE
ncbi:MAG: hypothetical protein FDW93_06970 [Bergeyella sp.]|nr:hypothetical protein [Bergeyella sp.]